MAKITTNINTGDLGTNLSLSQTSNNFTINSDTGTDAIVPLGNGMFAGATLNNYTSAEKSKLQSIIGVNTGDQDLSFLAPKNSPTFTGVVVLPSTTSIGSVSSTEIGRLLNVNDNIQTQLNGKQKTLTLTTNGNGGASTLDQITGTLNIPQYPGELQKATLNNQTFEYSGTNVFVLSNAINNVLQVIVNATSLHPEAYVVYSPSTISILNELHYGDIITIAYNYIEEVAVIPNLQNVTDIGNHTNKDIIFDNTLNEYGDYVVTNTLNELGAFQSYTSITQPQYQSEYAGYGMSISEVYDINSHDNTVVNPGSIFLSNTNIGVYNTISMNPGNLSMSINSASVLLKMDNVEGSLIMQYPNKENGSYTIATIEDVNSQSLQLVTNNGSSTTNSITANSFIKSGATGTNVLLDNGSTVALSSIGGSQNLQQVTNIGASATNTITINPTVDNDGLVVNASGTGVGVIGVSIDGNGVSGESTNGNGVYGFSDDNVGVYSVSNTGVGVYGYSQDYVGVYAYSTTSIGLLINGNGTNAIVANLGNSNKGLEINSGASSTGDFIQLNKNSVNKLTVNSEGATSIFTHNQTSLTITSNSDEDDSVGINVYGGLCGIIATGVTNSIRTYNAEVGILAEANGTSVVAQLNDSGSNGIKILSSSSSTGIPFKITKNFVDKLTINQAGELTATKLIKNGGTGLQILAADGSIITPGENISISGGVISSTGGGGGGGGSSVSYYLNGGTAASVGGYYQFSQSAVVGTGVDFPLTGNGLISQWLTDVGDPNKLQILGGNWNFETYMSVSSSGGSPGFYVELLKYNGTTFTTIANNSGTPEIITTAAIDLYFSSLAIPQTTLLATDRLVLRYYIVNVTGGRTVTMHTQNGHLCQVITNFTNGVMYLNGLNASSQNFGIATTGSDFNIASSGSTHTFYLPSASSSNRGALASTDWTTFNNKQNALNGTGFVKISGTTISYDNSTYLTSNQSITLSGAITGTGATTITTTLGTGVVGLANLSATGTRNNTTYLKGDNTWGTIAGSETTTTMGTLIGSAGDATPNDTDYVATALTAGGLLKKITWTNVKAFLKTYFDAIYSPNVYNILITSTGTISTDTQGQYNSISYSQNGKNVMINNSSTNIIFQVNTASETNFTSSYTKLSNLGVNITFANGTATVVSPTGLYVLSGNPGSTATLTRNGNTYYLLINNL